jgi:hypothetical protein
MNSLRLIFILATVESLLSCATAGSSVSYADPAPSTGNSDVEDIYILRSLLEQRSAPDEFCAVSKVGFVATVQDSYSFKAVITRAPDGRVVDARTHESGTLRACFDGAPGTPDANFYGEGVFAGVSATGKGKCTPIALDFPEPGIKSIRCFLVLSNLPPQYVAGVLTTNSITSRVPVGDRSDPPGYTQPSIATIRLWRKSRLAADGP